MKITKIFGMMMALTALFFVSCDKETPDNTGGDDAVTISLDESYIEVEVNSSVKLNATTTPSGGTVTWSSDDNDVATVLNGTVIGKKEGETKVRATCGTAQDSCVVKVTSETGPSGPVDFTKIPCLQGSNYYPIVLSGAARDYLGSKIIQDLGPDGDGGKDAAGKLTNARNLWYWDETVLTGTPEGTNSFGEMDGYLCIQRGTSTWAGGGFAVAPPADCPITQPLDLTAIYAHPEQYYFHLALKVTDPSFSVTLGLGDGVQNGKNEVKFTFGNVSGDNGQAPRAAIPQDGMWHEFEIPCTEFVKGDKVMYEKPFYDANILFFLLFPSEGVTMHLDAAFFYKK